jgi:hypothetical protein
MSNKKEMRKATIVNGKVIWSDETFSLEDTSPTFKDFDRMHVIIARTTEEKNNIETIRQALLERKSKKNSRG